LSTRINQCHSILKLIDRLLIFYDLFLTIAILIKLLDEFNVLLLRKSTGLEQ